MVHLGTGSIGYSNMPDEMELVVCVCFSLKPPCVEYNQSQREHHNGKPCAQPNCEVDTFATPKILFKTKEKSNNHKNGTSRFDC